MLKLVVFQGKEVITEFSHIDYGTLMRFTLNSLAELLNHKCEDFRLDITDKSGRCYFHAQGPKTPINDAVNRK